MNASYEDYIERLSHLKRHCQPHINEASRSNIEGICKKIYNKAKEETSKICAMCAKIWKENMIDGKINV